MRPGRKVGKIPVKNSSWDFLLETIKKIKNMKTAKELYTDPFMPCDYTPILNNFGEVILREDEDNYQGDTHAVIKSDNKFGYLAFGWGSCSGCDRLQACNTYEDIQELIDSLYNDIKWFESFNALKEYVNDDSIQELKYHYHTEVFNSFRNKLNNEFCMLFLEGTVRENSTFFLKQLIYVYTKIQNDWRM